MKRMKLLLGFISVIMLLFTFASVSCAAPIDTGFYFGFECGEASLNNDLYIYSDEAMARQPELGIKESHDGDDPAYSLYFGYNFSSKSVGFLGGNPTLLLGVQGGYSDLGEYTLNVKWNSDNPGYRKVEENSVDLLLSSTLIWDNGFNISGKFGVARLSGKYVDSNLPDPRQPDVPFKGETDCTFYRPEIALGVGYLINDHINIYLQYNAILGDTPATSADRFNDNDMIDMPNTLYKAERFSLGIAFMF